MESRLDSPAPERVAGVKRGRGRQREPIDWTGWVASPECVQQEKPLDDGMTAGTSASNRTEVTWSQAAEKSR
jgi:hypothetical protein